MTNWTKGWLARARITDDPDGDLIADMPGDPNVPSLFGSADEWLHAARAGRLGGRTGGARWAGGAGPKIWAVARERRKTFVSLRPLAQLFSIRLCF
jgi:hypothetical protein